MLSDYLIETKSKISQMHGKDTQQLSVIFSSKERIMVEAPAGYGKTTTIISRLAYLLAIKEIPFPKKILALTFSVNAALKMKRDVSSKLPDIVGGLNNPYSISKKLLITNYHGFCKYILYKYGYLISEDLRDINALTAITDKELDRIGNSSFCKEEKDIVEKFNISVKSNKKINRDLIEKYNEIIKSKIIPQGIITHDAVITFTIQLFLCFDEIKRFYNCYFPILIIDEFQDTNVLAWFLIHLLIKDETKLLFVGDHLQKIYGFIGACPNIMERCKNLYQMEEISLKSNYRFKNNPEMLKLDYNLRKNAENNFFENNLNDAYLPYHYANTQYQEADWIADMVIKLISENSSTKAAILVKARGKNTEIIESALINRKVNYFYGLFKDDDSEYINFHYNCLEIFTQTFSGSVPVTIQKLIAFAKQVESKYESGCSKTEKALIQLLFALVEKIETDYKEIDPNDRKSLLIDIFENRQLKQSMEYVSSSVIFSTIHSSKGLEWDYVFVADVEQSNFPFYYTCQLCKRNRCNQITNGSCQIAHKIDDELYEKILEEFYVFYVAITRAKNQAYISSSSQQFDYKGFEHNNVCLSCFANLSGIKLINV